MFQIIGLTPRPTPYGQPDHKIQNIFFDAFPYIICVISKYVAKMKLFIFPQEACTIAPLDWFEADRAPIKVLHEGECQKGDKI